MKKNTAGQTVGDQLVSASTGAAFTGAVTVYVTGDKGTQAVGSVGAGACEHEGNGFHSYAPSVAETNYNHVAFTFIGTGAIPRTVQVYPSTMKTDVVTFGTAQAGATASITLATTASSTNGTYDPAIVMIVAGTGAGQARMILQYEGSTRIASVDRDWRITPDATSEYQIVASANLMTTNEGLAQGGGASMITLNASASAVDNTYVGQTVVLRTGTGQDQSRIVASYVGATKVATMSAAWETQPAAGTGYMMLPVGRARVASMESGVLTAAAIAADAFTAAKFAADVTTELQSGLATAADVSAIKIKTDFLPSATAGASGGLFIAGSNAATSITTALTANIVGNVTGNLNGNVTGNLSGSVGSVSGAVGSVTGAVGSVTGLTAANLDVAISTRMATYAQPAGFLAASFPSSVASPTNIPTAIENADALLNRDMAAGTDSGSPTFRTLRQAVRFLRNKWFVIESTLTVTKEDDTAVSWTSTVSTTPGANPVTGNDPA